MTAHEKNPRPDVLVAGAGIVGVSSALWAQRRGMSVVLADANPPGSGASFGNAGTIATYGCVPLNSPSLFRDLPGLLTSKTSPLRIDWFHALRNLPWMISFLRNCTPDRVRHITQALADILSRVDAGLDPLVADAGAEDLFVSNDFVYVWSTAAGRMAAESALETRKRYGSALESLTGPEVAELEPNLAARFHSGVRFDGIRHVRDPEALVRRLSDQFVAGGGSLLPANVSSIDTNGDSVLATLSNGEQIYAGQIVIAAGAHSKSILGSGAEDIPLGTERGYHVMFKDHSDLVSRPVGWAEGGFYAVPMSGGLRLAGTVEIAGLEAPPTPERTNVLVERGHAMFGDIGSPTSTWLGFRPTVPDSLPVIGRSHRSERIIFAFGHQHLGLTLGGITGRIVVDLAERRAPNFDISAFDPGRFGTVRR